jgi:hypothetical protein
MIARTLLSALKVFLSLSLFLNTLEHSRTLSADQGQNSFLTLMIPLVFPCCSMLLRRDSLPPVPTVVPDEEDDDPDPVGERLRALSKRLHRFRRLRT